MARRHPEPDRGRGREPSEPSEPSDPRREHRKGEQQEEEEQPSRGQTDPMDNDLASRRVTHERNETKRFPGWARKLKHPPTSDIRVYMAWHIILY